MSSHLLPISILCLFYLLTPTQSYTCTLPHSRLPTTSDCHELIDALEGLSHLHPFNIPKLWSRSVEDTLTTLKLPKDYWLQGRGPSTCAIHVDAVPWNTSAEETFSLASASIVAEIIVEQCLIRGKKLGWAYPGPREQVQVKILRTDSPWLRRKVSEVRRVAVVGNGTILFEATDVKRHKGNGITDVAVQR